MNTVFRNIIVISFVAILTACGSTPKPTLVVKQPQCNFLPEEPQPVWVSGASQIEGFYTGVGDSDASNNNDEATQVARQRALANLSSSIQTNVSQQLNIKIQQSTSNQEIDEGLSQDVASQTKSITENLIKNSIRDDIWLDRQGCRLWMRMKVTKAGVEEIQKKNVNKILLERAKSSFEIASDRSVLQAKRMSSIEEALKLIDKIDFDVLPLDERDAYIFKYRRLSLQLKQQLRSNEIVVFTLADQVLPDSVHTNLAFHINKRLDKSKHIYPAPCKDRDSCLNLALDLHSQKMVVVSIQASSSVGVMGSRLGELNVDIASYDVASRRQLGQLKSQKAQVLSFDAQKIDWDIGINKMFMSNPEMTKLLKAIKEY